MSREAELRLRERLGKLRRLNLLGRTSLNGEVERLQRQLAELDAKPTTEEVWQAIKLARHDDRPYTLDYVERILTDWFELHGDRHVMDDKAMVAGLGCFDGRTVVLVGTQKGRDLKERVRRRFGSSSPEGYRKAMRAMEIAERHRFPVITLIDTPGAYPGVAAEQHGQGGALAASQALMARLTVPTVSCVIGEANSGGAIAIGLTDRILMQQNSYYAVISPEGGAAIMWRDAEQAEKAAAAFKPDARHCLELGIIDAIVPEPEGGAHTDYDAAAALLAAALREHLAELDDIPADELRRLRRKRYRALGVFAQPA
jgi:acetyl-CoA carboxylase carboxyl transferase subunit alpha